MVTRVTSAVHLPHAVVVTTMLLVHGGLWGDEDAEFFWHRPGITGGLVERGVEVVAPDRLWRAESWAAEADWLADRAGGPAVVVAGSYGCSAAARLAVERPDIVRRLVLAWPGTANDPEVDAFTREALAGFGASEQVIDALLGGETLRGVTDDELYALGMPVAVVPCVPENRTHQRRTVDALKDFTGAVELAGCPEPPRPGFQPDGFIDSIVQFGLSR
jgi:pimeloyl-ACP methyl ester carboxylesterase